MISIRRFEANMDTIRLKSHCPLDIKFPVRIRPRFSFWFSKLSNSIFMEMKTVSFFVFSFSSFEAQKAKKKDSNGDIFVQRNKYSELMPSLQSMKWSYLGICFNRTLPFFLLIDFKHEEFFFASPSLLSCLRNVWRLSSSWNLSFQWTCDTKHSQVSIF